MNNKIHLINQALNAAESSIRLARQMISELEGSKTPSTSSKESDEQGNFKIGVFDGEGLTLQNGDKHPVPANYASKSMLVVGDTLKVYEENGEQRFKQIEHVKRHRTTGMLTKKDGKFRVVTPEGSYKVLGASIEHFKGEVGDEVTAFLPAGNLISSYAALESVKKKDSKAEPTSEVPVVEEKGEKPKVQETKQETKPEDKKPEEKSAPVERKPFSQPPRPREHQQQRPLRKDFTPKPKQPAAPAPKIEKIVEAPVSAPTEQPVEIKMPDVAEDELR